jgi:hypothetical protein
MAGLILGVPSYYRPQGKPASTPLRECIRSLQPFESLIAREGVVFLKGDWALEVFGYLAHEHSAAVHDYGFLREWSSSERLDEYLARRGVSLFYVDQNLLTRLRTSAPESGRVFLGSGSDEWKLVACQALPGHEWKLFARKVSSPPPISVDIAVDLGRDGVDAGGIGSDGWVGSQGGLTLGRATGATRVRIRGMVPLIDDPEFSTTAIVLIDGRELLTKELKPGDFEVLAPLTPAYGVVRVELKFGRLQTLPNGDGRHIAARLYSAATLQLVD